MNIGSNKGNPPVSSAGPAQCADDADRLLRQAWASHRSERETMLQLDATVGYIDPGSLRRRLDRLAQVVPSVAVGRAIQAQALAHGASIQTDELASGLALLLQDAIIDEDIQQTGDAALVTRWLGPDSAPELADDALVLAHLALPVEDGVRHEFWVQWWDSAGEPAGYHMLFVRPDPGVGFESLGHDKPQVTLRVEKLGLAMN